MMIYRVEVSSCFFSRQLFTGKVFPRTQITKGLPKDARFFHAYAGQHGNWYLLFEGPPETGADVEGAVTDMRIEFTEIHGDAPLPIPEVRLSDGDR